MILVVAGEDVRASRSHLINLKDDYIKKGFTLRPISFEELPQLRLWLGSSPNLFNSPFVFIGEHFNKKINMRNKVLAEELIEINRSTEISLLIWEELPKRLLKLGKIAQVKEFPLRDSIFKLLDSFFPSNRSKFLQILEGLTEYVEDSFIFAMLVRHTRNLILAKSQALPKTIQPWQASKLIKQSTYWRKEDLLRFYEALLRIDIANKTSSNPYTFKQSIDILSVHFL